MKRKKPTPEESRARREAQEARIVELRRREEQIRLELAAKRKQA